ncbi:uncharacterized protein Dmul_22920 [Desulfococcus multivorans]|nr:uncharacterized protein Dmul_22920 [Desulfococcus multivorans]
MNSLRVAAIIPTPWRKYRSAQTGIQAAPDDCVQGFMTWRELS